MWTNKSEKALPSQDVAFNKSHVPSKLVQPQNARFIYFKLDGIEKEGMGGDFLIEFILETPEIPNRSHGLKDMNTIFRRIKSNELQFLGIAYISVKETMMI